MKNAEIVIGEEYHGRYGGRYRVIETTKVKHGSWDNSPLITGFLCERLNPDTGEILAQQKILARDLKKTWAEYQAELDAARAKQEREAAFRARVIARFATVGLVLDDEDVRIRDYFNSIVVVIDQDAFAKWEQS